METLTMSNITNADRLAVIERARGFGDRYDWFCRNLMYDTPLFDDCKKISAGTHVAVDKDELEELKELAWMYKDLTT